MLTQPLLCAKHAAGRQAPDSRAHNREILSTMLSSVVLGGRGQALHWGLGLHALLPMAEFRALIQNMKCAPKIPGFESQLCHFNCDLRHIT